jgi:hypothetical protein
VAAVKAGAGSAGAPFRSPISRALWAGSSWPNIGTWAQTASAMTRACYEGARS